jgi:hypothetical protein
VIDPDEERWRRLTVKEDWRRFVADEPTQRPERIRLGDHRRLDERARSAYDLERLRHAHGFGPIRSLYAAIHRTLERLVVSNELRGPGRGMAPPWMAIRGTARPRSSAISAASTSGAAAPGIRTS